ncbi:MULTISPECIES: malto-oligosyltrehalose trehalohydrolase [unclassified Frigoribacterium]|uniref:malto-oligosyltrehalose trehalohydrolase n=1 Tax=unclassified Frigoribacterium TaxID=2627005 RepID=UPI0015662734|nr:MULTISPECIES: malto-oligosyltrehalose trehalohydrolase [unclassified Frigoribacterium]NQW88457.1 malto-oligosyltrehalose trehalohydrolase [Frigoribacterium sp. VKM Ac-2860]NQX08734.1 malto-oligosyltrehalose trehalohydrolase [Frigoribacterium sp. VKM Ac-2859]
MSVYDVWAPKATTVHLHLDGELLPLSAEPDTGWWRAPADLDPGPGHRYGFVLDGGDSPEGETPLPDPRSRRQPDGVHGLSETYDPGAFAWTDDAWTGRQLAGSVVYELHVGTFTPGGTLDSAIEKLPHLVDLGVDLVELLPVNGVNGRWNWGYDGVDWFTVTDNYGGPEAYQRFVDAAHAAGLGVVQDVVYNHLGPSGNYLPLFGPYLSSKHANTWGDNVNLDDDGAHEVREFILDNTAMWLDDYHVDGLRLDAVHALKDDSEVHLLQELAERTAALSSHLRRPLSLIAESDLNDPRLVTPRDGGGFGPDHRQGYGLDAQWSDDFHHAVHVALTGETTGYYADFEPLGALAKVLTKGFFHDGTWSSFREATHGYPVDTEHMPTWRLVVANQNHDQIGNRAIGDRLAATLDDGQLIIAAALTLAGPYTPMLFMGEEWGASTPWQFFTSHPEHDLGEATAKGRIEEFAKMGWDESSVPDPQAPSTFEDSKLDWSELETGRHAVLLDAYRRLGALRRSEPALTDPRFGETGVEYDGDARWLVLTRGDLKMAINLADQEARVAVSAETVLFASDASIAAGSSLLLPAHSVAIVR